MSKDYRVNTFRLRGPVCLWGNRPYRLGRDFTVTVVWATSLFPE